MQSLGSFSAKHVGKAYMVEVEHFRRDDESLFFQFDTGAHTSLIGLNSICDDNGKNRDILNNLVCREITQIGILFQKPNSRTVTKEEVELYPCCISGISIMGTGSRKLYFHIYLGDINLPLLGFDFIDDCSIRHSRNGDMEIIAVPDDAGRRFYPGKVIDFDKILDEYYAVVKE